MKHSVSGVVLMLVAVALSIALGQPPPKQPPEPGLTSTASMARAAAHSVVLIGDATRAHTLFPRPGDPPIIRRSAHIVLTLFSGTTARFSYIPCLCSNPVCGSGCLQT
ncbi:MAG TPA: hypothetical protein VJT31_38925 [Rugosimonospora sp.]|nr:hypothetical protein [Rugosimonospora sp.]